MQTFLGRSALLAVLLQGSTACTSNCNEICYNAGEHCCSEDDTYCYCKPIGVSCGAAPVNISEPLKLAKKDDELAAPTCTSNCNGICYNAGEHCCSEDADYCYCKPIGVSCGAAPGNISEPLKLVKKDDELAAPTCTSNCNEICYNAGEHCCSEDADYCYCKPIGVSCGAAPVNMSELVKDELEAPTCSSGCNEACYNMGAHCCSEDSTTCYCQPIGVSCAAESDNQFEKLMVVREEVSAPECTSGCNSACYNMGEHCCGMSADEETCYCRPTGVSCASEQVDNSAAVALVRDEEVSSPTCTSECNGICYNMGEHCCSEDSTTCYCRPIGVSCGSGQSNATRRVDLVKEGSAGTVTV